MSTRARLVAIIAVVGFAFPALVNSAQAQGRGFRGGAPAAPHVAAPAAPHFAAPAAGARFSAPAAVPHVAAPRFSAPHVSAAPRFAGPRFAAPHFNAPRMAGPGRAAPYFHTQRFAGRPFAAPRFTPHNRIGTAHAVPRGMPPSTATVGRVSAGPTGRAARTAQPILSNPVFAARSERGGRATALTTGTTFRGAFAQSSLAQTWQRGDRHHHHRFGVVLGFIGLLFWPYAYDDFVDYTFWPYGYDTFWPYAFDDLYGGIYGAYAPEIYAPDEAYAYAGAPATTYLYGGRPRRARAELPGSNLRVCTGEVDQLVNFPIDRIREQVAPDEKQQQLLDDLKAATAKAVEALQNACPTELPSTPPGRLAAMRTRVEAMLKAVQIVRPALESFYQSLSDEQKERFNSLDQSGQAALPGESELARLCAGKGKAGKSGFGVLPIDRIQRTLNLSASQDADLKDLTQASDAAQGLLKASCETNPNLTPTGRLAAIEDRLNALLQAIATVQPQLAKFYNSLTDEQKARFDRLSRPA